jgi:hypothetical protein
MSWEERVACLAERRVAYFVSLGKPVGNRQLGNLGVDKKILLKRSLQEMG